jgi:pyruvate ferredoxin oxidoreductase alpha subunit
VIDETYTQFEGSFGRSYQAVEPYFTDGAESILIVTGSAASTAFHTVRKLREQGRKVGILRLRQLRPFPAEALRNQLNSDSVIAVLDRNLSPGTGGVFTQEVRAAFSRSGINRQVHEFVAGLGGRDITSSDIEHIFDDLDNKKADPSAINWVGLNR